MNILIVDDARDIRFLMRVHLQKAGYTVAGEANGQEALDHLAATTDRPCLILLDLMMPVMNGWEFRARQLADPALASIPVVILSAAPPGDAATEALHAVAVLKKPPDFAAILALAAQYCAAEP
jgi:CheY-like chemotaxis protein